MTQVSVAKGVWEVALLARVDLLLHSLNNEGSVGTSMRPRRLTVPTASGLEERDGVSGEMLKHGHAAFLHYLAVSGDGLPLCEGCRFLHPQRAAYPSPTQELTAYQAIEKCVICDVHGFLIPGQNVHRETAIQFSWAVTTHGAVRQSHQHARHDPFRGRGEGNTVQMPYQRPTRSGTYALVTLVQLWRIGVDLLSSDGNGFRKISPDQRKRRAEATVEALRSLLLRPDGAMVATRLPHLTGAHGVLLVSEGPPVPIISPLGDSFTHVARDLAEKVGARCYPFSSLEDMAQHFQAVLQEINQHGPGEPALPGQLRQGAGANR